MEFIEYLWRIGVALLLGAIIGLERNKRVKGAGIRTHGIVSVGACLFMLISQYAYEGVGWDASRIASTVVTGVGFLGVGIIYNRSGAMQGLTTAAGVWTTAAIGMCCGSSNITFVLVAALDNGEDHDTDGRADDAAVDGQAALPNIEDPNGVGRIGIPLENAVVQSGAQHRKGNDAQHAVDEIIFLQAEFLAAAAGIQHRQHHTQGDQYAIPMDLQRSNGETGCRIPGKPDSGKGYCSHMYSSLILRNNA